jgi:hypothetical protein
LRNVQDSVAEGFGTQFHDPIFDADLNSILGLDPLVKFRKHKQMTSVADPGCLSRNRIFSIPDPSSFHFGFSSKNLSVLTQKTVLRVRDAYPETWILIFTHARSRISDPKVAIKESGEKKFVVIPFL